MVKILILGAGPAGLAFANSILKSGESSFLVLEKESEAGGLCRSKNVDGSPLDIGGGHFLDVKMLDANKFLFQFMPENEWNIYTRDSRIVVNDNVINSPIEANVWQMKLEDQVEYLKSIAIAGCNLAYPKPEKFVDWIYWKLGKKIAVDYMVPYNQKIFSKELNELGTYWLDKLPNVSFEETILSCLTKQAYGKQPGHTQFYYPKKYGYGELWLRIAQNIQNNIEYDVNIKSIDFYNRIINGKYQGEIIINTIPWKEFDELLGMPQSLKDQIEKLKYSSIETKYFPENIDTNAHWIYYPNLNISYHRKLIRHNFYYGAKGCWTETNSERVNSEKTEFRYLNKYAYPLNTIEKPVIMQELLEWARKFKVYGLGRWGEWQHYNSDVTVSRALKLAEQFYSE